MANAKKSYKSSGACSTRKAKASVSRSSELSHTHVPTPSLFSAGRLGLSLAMSQRFIDDRSKCDVDDSYTAYMASMGSVECAKAAAGDGIRLIESLASGCGPEAIVSRSSDILYNLMIILRQNGLSMNEVSDEIIQRVIESGYKVSVFEKLVRNTLQEKEAADYLAPSRYSSVSSVSTSKPAVLSGNANGQLSSVKKMKTKVVANEAVSKKLTRASKPARLGKASVVKLHSGKPARLSKGLSKNLGGRVANN